MLSVDYQSHLILYTTQHMIIFQTDNKIAIVLTKYSIIGNHIISPTTTKIQTVRKIISDIII